MNDEASSASGAERQDPRELFARYSPDIVAQYDRELRILYVSPAIERYSDLRADDLVGQSLEAIAVGAERRAFWADRIREVFRTGQPAEHTYSTEGHGGPLHWVWYLYPHAGREGRVESVMSFARDVTELVRQSERLRQSEQNYRLLVENLSDLVVKVDAEGRFEFVSPSYCRAFGKTEAELFGEGFMPLVHEDDRETTEEAMASLYRPPYRAYLEQRALTVDGWRWIAWADTAILDASGQVESIIGVGRDIHERKRYQDLLDARLRLNEASPALSIPELLGHTVEVALGLTESEHGFVYVYSPDEEVLTRRAWTARDESRAPPPPRISLEAAGRWAACVRELRPVSSEGAAGGREVVVPVVRQGQLVAIMGVGGRAEGYSELDLQVTLQLADFAWDASERWKTERLHRAMFTSSPDGVLTLDWRLRVADVNESYCRMTGYRRDELIGRRMRELEIGGELVTLDALRRAGQLRYEARHRKKTGARFFVEVTASFLGLESASCAAFVRDVSHRRDLETRVRQAAKMESIGLLAGGIAHDLNNLLTPIMGNAELLRSQKDPSDPDQLELKEIGEAADRARDLVGKLLAFGRKQLLTVATVDLARMVRRLEPILRRTVPETIELFVDCGEDQLWVEADEAQLERVVLNLCVNAQDAMPDGGQLRLECAVKDLTAPKAAAQAGLPPGKYAALSVTDTGHGMDTQTLERVFEPFFTTKEVGKGTGLGLATAHGILEQHGGTITASSAPEQGSTFTMCLPLTTGKPSKKTKARKRQAASFAGKRVLLVEDQDPVRVVVQRLLRELRFEVVSSEDPRKAIARVEAEDLEFDVLLTDVIMPGMSGRELYDKLKARSPELRVVYISGYSQDVLARHGVDNRQSHFLAKPFGVEAVGEVLRQALEA